jgi:hypothetical protein
MKAPPDVLFQAWTVGWDRWFAAPGTVLMKAEVNRVFHLKLGLRVTAMHTMDAFFDSKQTVVELTWLTAATKGAEMLVTVEFVACKPGTQLRLTHAGFPDEPSRDRHNEAWPKVLAQLDRQMAKRD